MSDKLTFDDLTVKQLKEVATAAEVDLKDATKRDDIIKVLIEAKVDLADYLEADEEEVAKEEVPAAPTDEPAEEKTEEPKEGDEPVADATEPAPEAPVDPAPRSTSRLDLATGSWRYTKVGATVEVFNPSGNFVRVYNKETIKETQFGSPEEAAKSLCDKKNKQRINRAVRGY